MKSDREVLEGILEEGQQRFAKVTKNDRNLYGKLHGSKDLLAYARYIDPGFNNPKHIVLIKDALLKVYQGKIKRLIINLPPRYGKTQLTSKIFPSWWLGHRPNSKMIVSSYGIQLAGEITQWLRDTCESDIYKTIFPEFSIRKDSRAKEYFQTNHGGVVIGAGTDGPIMGRGADLAIIDDPHKSLEDARSERSNERVWNWYRSQMRARLHPGASVVVVHQRLTKNDLTGRLIENEGLVDDGGVWTQLKLPALDAIGNPLWPERYSYEEIQDLRKGTGELIFQALYMQDPDEFEEKIFTDLKFEEAPEKLKHFGYLDPAFGGADSNALTIAGAHKTDSKTSVYVAFGDIWQGLVANHYDRIVKICKDYNVSVLGVESNQAQRLVAGELRKRGLIVKDMPSVSNKHLRIVNYGKSHWEHTYFSKNVTERYLSQVKNYSEYSEHDDAPDSFAGVMQLLPIHTADIRKRYVGLMNVMRGDWM